MTKRRELIERSASRDTALIAGALEALRQQLDSSAQDARVRTPEVDALVAAALVELHRIMPDIGRAGGSPPAFGAPTLQELLRRSRSDGEPSMGEVANHRVDIVR